MDTFQQRLEQEQSQLHQQLTARLIELGASSQVLAALAQQGFDGIADFLPELPDRQLYALCQRLGKVEAALCQIEQGVYGICCDCEAEIDMERLVADPAEQRCRHCDNKAV